jgi:DNA repair exonuclease SbcCD ATPase subunit
MTKKSKKLFLSALLLVPIVAGTAPIKPGQQPAKKSRPNHEQMKQMQERIMQAAGLSEHEKEKLQAYTRKENLTVQRLHRQLYEAMQQLKEKERNLQADEKEIDQAIEAVQAVQARLMKIRALRMRKVRALIGREKAERLVEATRAHMKQRENIRGPRPGHEKPPQ